MKTQFDMNADALVEGDFVLRTGLAFRLANYPDKSFSLDEPEADSSVTAFVPIPLNVEHQPSLFDGLLGRVQKIWRDGKTVMAEFRIPRWLHEITNGKPLPVSCEWETTPAGKRLTGCALVLNPRVRDAMFSITSEELDKAGILATMVSNFTEAQSAEYRRKDKPQTYHGRQAIQEGHDHTARSGAICEMDTEETKSKKMSASFAYKHEMKAIQAAHDIYHGAGAVCGAGPYSLYSDNAAIPATHKEAPMNEDEIKKSLFDKIKAAFGIETHVVETPLPYSPPTPASAPEKPAAAPQPVEFKVEETALYKEQKERADALQAQIDAQQAAIDAKFSVDNAAAIETLVGLGKVDPAKKAEFADKRKAMGVENFDTLVAPNLPVKFAARPQAAPGTIDGHDALLNAYKNNPEAAQFTADIAALPDGGLKL